MPDENPNATDPSETSNQPSYITAEQLNAQLAPLTQAFQTLQESLQTIAAARNDRQVQTEDVPLNITDAELAEELQAGGVGKLRKILDQNSKQHKKELEALSTQGLNIMADQAMTIAKLTGVMPHYDRFKKQIDETIARLPLAQRTSASTFKYIHDAIVGQNLPTLLKEKEEEIIRAAREKDGSPGPGSAGSRQVTTETKADGVPTFEEHFGKETAARLNEHGRNTTPDEFCRKMGYKDWPDYYNKAIKIGQGATA